MAERSVGGMASAVRTSSGIDPFSIAGGLGGAPATPDVSSDPPTMVGFSVLATETTDTRRSSCVGGRLGGSRP